MSLTDDTTSQSRVGRLAARFETSQDAPAEKEPAPSVVASRVSEFQAERQRSQAGSCETIGSRTSAPVSWTNHSHHKSLSNNPTQKKDWRQAIRANASARVETSKATAELVLETLHKRRDSVMSRVSAIESRSASVASNYLNQEPTIHGQPEDTSQSQLGTPGGNVRALHLQSTPSRAAVRAVAYQHNPRNSLEPGTSLPPLSRAERRDPLPQTPLSARHQGGFGSQLDGLGFSPQSSPEACSSPRHWTLRRCAAPNLPRHIQDTIHDLAQGPRYQVFVVDAKGDTFQVQFKDAQGRDQSLVTELEEAPASGHEIHKPLHVGTPSKRNSGMQVMIEECNGDLRVKVTPTR